MKEDILEQIADDYLNFKGFFTVHNVKFKPAETHPEYFKRDDCVDSDVDVVGFHPKNEGVARVWVVSCKSWQAGFDPKARIAAIEGNKILAGKEAWRGFRELVRTKWVDALITKIESLTGSREFTYVTAVTRLIGDRSVWETYQPFIDKLQGNPIKILTLKEMLDDLDSNMKNTLAASEVGRLLQVIKASGWQP
ncbi:MAG: hypothetical protein ABSD64_04070 [Terriglobales bacterium]|jgi:hypothetical protein